MQGGYTHPIACIIHILYMHVGKEKHGIPSFSAICFACSGVYASSPCGTATPYLLSISRL